MDNKYLKNKLKNIIEDPNTSEDNRLIAINYLSDINKEENINMFSYIQLFLTTIVSYKVFGISKIFRR